VTAQSAFAPLPTLPLPVSDSHRYKDQHDHSRQPRLIGPPAHEAKHRIDQPEKGNYEPDGGTTHFFLGA